MKVGKQKQKKGYNAIWWRLNENSANFVKFIFSKKAYGSESLLLYKNGEGYDINGPNTHYKKMDLIRLKVIEDRVKKSQDTTNCNPKNPFSSDWLSLEGWSVQNNWKQVKTLTYHKLKVVLWSQQNFIIFFTRMKIIFLQ